jgi:hypothetical protein
MRTLCWGATVLGPTRDTNNSTTVLVGQNLRTILRRLAYIALDWLDIRLGGPGQ